MRRIWFYCKNCKTTHPETYPGGALYVCPYCSSTSIEVVSRSDVAASLHDGTLLPIELKATCHNQTSGGDRSAQANIRLTGELPVFRPPTKE